MPRNKLLDLGPGRALSGDLHALNQIRRSLRSTAALVRETRNRRHFRAFASEGAVAAAALRSARARF